MHQGGTPEKFRLFAAFLPFDIFPKTLRIHDLQSSTWVA